MKDYKVLIGCYAGKRGNILAALVQERIKDINHGSLDIVVEGMGHPKYIGQRQNTKIPQEYLAQLKEVAKKHDKAVQRAAEKLDDKVRYGIDAESLQEADAVFAADSFIRDEYRKLASEDNSDKYRTVLQGARIKHSSYGDDLDDTECTVDYTRRVIVPKLSGKTPEDVKPEETVYIDLDGNRHLAGDKKALSSELENMIEVANYLAHYILCEAYSSL
jgi:hypothetical protein